MARDVFLLERVHQPHALVDGQHGGDGGDDELRGLLVPEQGRHLSDVLSQLFQFIDLILVPVSPEQPDHGVAGPHQTLAQLYNLGQAGIHELWHRQQPQSVPRWRRIEHYTSKFGKLFLRHELLHLGDGHRLVEAGRRGVQELPQLDIRKLLEESCQLAHTESKAACDVVHGLPRAIRGRELLKVLLLHLGINLHSEQREIYTLHLDRRPARHILVQRIRQRMRGIRRHEERGVAGFRKLDGQRGRERGLADAALTADHYVLPRRRVDQRRD
mmetsp:Transcript_6672/g.18520  ORF Transcript_6672/g.18520 Transcript_6672/m.18520 type:complete len:272 (+) Transcript_6672:1659-2474(+)